MKILLLTQVLPYPPDSGPKVKTWNLIKYLAREHDITLVSFVRDDPPSAIEDLERFCSVVHTVPMRRGYLRDGVAFTRSLLTGDPWMMIRDDRRGMRELVDRLVAEQSFDILHADQLNMCQYAMRAQRGSRIFDAHNALWVLYRRLATTMSGPKRWLFERDWRLLKRYEGKICRLFNLTTAVTEADRDALRQASGESVNIRVIPISVDLQEASAIPYAPSNNRVIHVGTMYWPPNVDGVLWFAHKVWPLIRARFPSAVFDVIGAHPPQGVQRLSTDENGINITGYVSDLQKYMERASAFIVPLRAGSGMRVKILNAMARGLPIVSTSMGCDGIRVTHERDILIADEPEVFAAAVLRIMQDPNLGSYLAVNARKLIETEYDYRIALQAWDDIYDSVFTRD